MKPFCVKRYVRFTYSAYFSSGYLIFLRCGIECHNHTFSKKVSDHSGLKISLQVITVTPFPPDLVGTIEQSLQSSSFATVQQKAYVAELYFGLECYIKLETINGNLNFDVWLRAIFMISLENFKDAFIHFIRISQVEQVHPLRSYTPHRIPDVRLSRIRLFAKRIVHIIIRIY